MRLNVLEANDRSVRAGYSCPCGCTPSVEYARDADVVGEGCCCGNRFAVGPKAGATLPPKAGVRFERQALAAPWGEAIEAAWLIGPSVHGPANGHAHEHAETSKASSSGDAIDPACGMTVEMETALVKGLRSARHGVEYFFCGKGCKLEFDDDPERYFASDYVPSM